MSRRTDSLNAYEVALTSGVSDVDTSFPVESTVGLIAPGYLVVDPDDPTKREYFKYTIINGANLQFPDTGFRGLRGSAAGAQGHLAGARVRAVAVGQWLDDIFSDIEDLEAEQAAFLDLAGTRAMFGDLNMGDNKIEVLATPVLDDDAATKLYVDTLDLLLLPLDGTRAMTGALDMGTNEINDVVDPTLAQDAATKKYVDDAIPIAADLLYLRLDTTNDPLTAPLEIITTTLPSLRIMSGTVGADADHASIALGSDSDVSAAEIVAHRGSASSITDLILRPHGGGGPLDALTITAIDMLSNVTLQIGSGANSTSIPFSVHRAVGGQDDALNVVISAAGGREGAVVMQQTRNGTERASLLIDGTGNNVIAEANSLVLDSDTTIADIQIIRRAIGRWWRWVVASNGDLLAQYSSNGTTWTTGLTIPDSPE
jgi:hypothetical protein